MVDSDTIAYPKRFLLLGMLLFKDILPILAVDHKDRKSQLSKDRADTSLYTTFHPQRVSLAPRQAAASYLGGLGEFRG
jgi:hypothetical protein